MFWRKLLRLQTLQGRYYISDTSEKSENMTMRLRVILQMIPLFLVHNFELWPSNPPPAGTLTKIDFLALQHIDSTDVNETLKRGLCSKNDHMSRSPRCYWSSSLPANVTASLFICCILLIVLHVLSYLSFYWETVSACVAVRSHFTRFSWKLTVKSSFKITYYL